MLSVQELARKLEQGLPGARVEIHDPRQDGIHLRAVITYKGFAGKPLLQQHRMVYAVLEHELSTGELHALALETKEG